MPFHSLSTQPTNSKPGPTPEVPTNPCGNGICEWQKDESPKSCPKDCTVLDLPLSSSANDASKAVMFTADAVKDVSFSSISVFGKKSRNSMVQIYTREGAYTGFENNPNEWILCFNSILLLQEEVPTQIDLECSTYTKGGESRSFQVYAKAGMRVEKSASSASLNDLIIVQNAVILKDMFNEVNDYGLMGGNLRYVTIWLVRFSFPIYLIFISLKGSMRSPLL